MRGRQQVQKPAVHMGSGGDRLQAVLTLVQAGQGAVSVGKTGDSGSTVQGLLPLLVLLRRGRPLCVPCRSLPLSAGLWTAPRQSESPATAAAGAVIIAARQGCRWLPPSAGALEHLSSWNQPASAAAGAVKGAAGQRVSKGSACRPCLHSPTSAYSAQPSPAPTPTHLDPAAVCRHVCLLPPGCLCILFFIQLHPSKGHVSANLPAHRGAVLAKACGLVQGEVGQAGIRLGMRAVG